jgi:hypothetical protein
MKRASLVACALVSSLSACQGMYIHNADRANVAALAKKGMDSVDVPAIVKTEHENLGKLLAEEIKSINARSKLVATLSVIQLAASDDSVATHYKHSLQKMKATFGNDNMLAMREASDCRIKKQTAEEEIPKLLKLFKAASVPNVPSCAEAKDGNRPDAIEKDEWNKYLNQCAAKAADCKIASEAEELRAARESFDNARKNATEDKEAFEEARKAYKAAVEANLKKTQAGIDAEQHLRKKAEDLLAKLSQLAKSSPSLANRVKGSALVDLLTAAASSNTDPSADPDLAPALEIAKSFPSLVGSVKSAQATGSIVPVSHLLLALNDLSIQADRDTRILALGEEQVGVLESKVAIRDVQADLWRRYSDQLCNLALLGASKEHPGKSCATLTFPSDAPTCTIRFGLGRDEQPQVVSDCLLRRTWRQLFDADLPQPQKRALYEAAAAYLQVRLLAYATTVEDFKRVDLLHRESVIRREAALSQWKNLVAVPTEELDAYYRGGIKPAELSDLIIKALGFTAVAVGVAQ